MSVVLRKAPTFGGKGSQARTAKLTEEQVAGIKQRLRNGETSTAISRDYKVSPNTIMKIKNGYSWNHVKI